MKRTKQCPKCDSLKVGHLASQPDGDDVIPSAGISASPAVGVVREPAMRALGLSTETIETGWMLHGTVTPLLGKLEAYVCTECGYHETYVAWPEKLPWEKLVGFRWINDGAVGRGPYR